MRHAIELEIDIGRLFDERAIERQLYTLARAMDRREWLLLDHVIADDATGDFGEGFEVKGRSGFVAMFERFLANCGPTQHLLGNVAIDIEGDVAESRCYVRDMHQGSGERAHLFLSTPGEYHDRWRRTSTGWLLTHRTKVNLMLIGSLAALGAD